MSQSGNTGAGFPGFGDVSVPGELTTLPPSDTPNFLTVLSRVVLACMIADNSIRFVRVGNGDTKRWYAVLSTGAILAILPSRGQGYGNDVEGVNVKRSEVNPRDYAEIHRHCFALDRTIKSDGQNPVAYGHTLERFTESGVDSWARSVILQYVGGIITNPAAAPTPAAPTPAANNAEIDSLKAAMAEQQKQLAAFMAMVQGLTTQPVATQPVATQPVETQPVATQPRQTRPRAASRK